MCPTAQKTSAFTILEIVIVLSIIVLIAGSATPMVASMVRAEQLKSPARALEAMAITARTRAISEQRLYFILLNANGFSLQTSVPQAGTVEISEFTLPDAVEFQVSSWPDNEWETPRNRIWYFPPGGLCEPIQTMFRRGDSYFSQTFGAVTGWERETTSMIR